MVARDVVARVEAVEVAVHLVQFLVAIGGQRLGGLVGGAPRALGGKASGEVGGGGQFGGAPGDIERKAGLAGQAGVVEAEPDRRRAPSAAGGCA